MSFGTSNDASGVIARFPAADRRSCHVFPCRVVERRAALRGSRCAFHQKEVKYFAQARDDFVELGISQQLAFWGIVVHCRTSTNHVLRIGT
jgi:hypothetical protein